MNTFTFPVSDRLVASTHTPATTNAAKNDALHLRLCAHEQRHRETSIIMRYILKSASSLG